MSLLVNTLNLMLLWISSDGAEQQAVRNGNHESGKVVKLTTTSIQVITEEEIRWRKRKQERKERREKKARVRTGTLDNTQSWVKRRKKFKKIESSHRDKRKHTYLRVSG